MKNMDYEKKYNEALNWMRELYPGLHGATKEDAEHYFPELKESEDERMLRVIRLALTDVPEERFTTEGTSFLKVLAWLEKQKEQPKEELVYRMNGLMQEYVKEGEDDAEKEHRLKCYQLFWDALEDADFFEQKEQKPAEWSEEDEKMRKNIIWLLEVHSSYRKEVDWLKSLKDRGNFPKWDTKHGYKGVEFKILEEQ